jgi:hypothetical protein
VGPPGPLELAARARTPAAPGPSSRRFRRLGAYVNAILLTTPYILCRESLVENTGLRLGVQPL